MNATAETLAAIYRVAKHLIFADDTPKDEEIQPLYDFFQTFPAVDQELLNKIIAAGEEMDDTRALVLIKGLDDDGKRQMANLFAKIICADNELTDKEKDLFFKVKDLCELPDPVDESSEEEPEAEKPAEEPAEEEEEIIPAFMVANFYGIVSVHQSEHEDWATLGDELASWIGCDRVEVVRFTPALNALTEKLRLNERHLVFMVARNGYGDKTVGDNMTATLLYGGGYPIYGNIVFALETDSGYEIEGFRTKSLLNEMFQAVNEAVDGLLRTE
jgi:uncharacterized tellurite resistance protein B-like protein